MSISTLIVIIGVVVSIFEALKDESKKHNKKGTKNNKLNDIMGKIPLNKMEKYIDKDILDGIKRFTAHEIEPEKKENIKDKLIEDKVEKKLENNFEKSKNKVHKAKDLPSSISVKAIKNQDILPKKKNIFEVTNNPVANAIIASEILGKPKCRK